MNFLTLCFCLLSFFLFMPSYNSFANSTQCSRFFKDAHIESIPKAIQNEGNVIFNFPHHKKRDHAISRGDTLIAYSQFDNRRVFVEWFRPVHEYPWFLPTLITPEQKYLFFRSEVEVSVFDKHIFNRILESPTRRPTNVEGQLSFINDFLHKELGYGDYVKYEDLFMTELASTLSSKSNRILKRVQDRTTSPSNILINFLDMVVHIAKSKTFFKKLQESIRYLRFNKSDFERFLENGWLDKTVDFDQHVFRIHNAKDMYQGLKSSKNPNHKQLLKDVQEKFSKLNFEP